MLLLYIHVKHCYCYLAERFWCGVSGSVVCGEVQVATTLGFCSASAMLHFHEEAEINELALSAYATANWRQPTERPTRSD